MIHDADKKLKRAATIAFQVITNLVLVAFSLFTLFPVIWMIMSSLKTGPEFFQDILAFPKSVYFQNYVNAFTIGRMGEAAINSVYVTAGSVAGILLFSFIIGYFLNRYSFRLRKVIYGVLLMGMLVPMLCFLVPIYIYFNKLGLLDKWYSLFFTDIAFALPLAVILIDNFLKSVPLDMEEAAVIDGAPMRIRLFSVVFPLCRPIISTLIILETLWTWNEYPYALILLNSMKHKTLPLMLSNFRGQYTTEYTSLFAALAIVSIPVLVIYSLFSEKIMQGMSAGAIKG